MNCRYDADRNAIDVDSSILKPQDCFEEYFVQDHQCILEHCNDMIQELTVYYTRRCLDAHLSFTSYLSELVSTYTQEAMIIYSAIRCQLEDLSIQQAMTECIEDCEACVNAQTEQGSHSDIPRRMLVADLVLKKAKELDIVKE